jgi:hypothetical protein
MSDAQKPQVVHFEIKPGPLWAWMLFLAVPALMFFWVVTHYGDGGIEVSGTVVDESGASIEGVVATLHPPHGSDIERFSGPKTMKSFDDGVFFLGLTFRPQRASFTLTVEKPGFQSVTLGPYEAPHTYQNIVVTLKPTAKPSTETDDK